MSKKPNTDKPTAPEIKLSWTRTTEEALELPSPLPLEFTPRQISYLFQLVAFDAGRQVYKDDPTALKVVQDTHTKLMLVQRMYFDDLEKVFAVHQSWRAEPTEPTA
jgi:hypothetical protein